MPLCRCFGQGGALAIYVHNSSACNQYRPSLYILSTKMTNRVICNWLTSVRERRQMALITRVFRATTNVAEIARRLAQRLKRLDVEFFLSDADVYVYTLQGARFTTLCALYKGNQRNCLILMGPILFFDLRSSCMSSFFRFFFSLYHSVLALF